MIRSCIWLTIFSLFFSNISYSITALDQIQTKEVISDLQTQISKTALDERGPLLVQLATAYLKDQDQEKAFRTYLQALTFIPKEQELVMDSNEKELYTKALSVYLSHNSGFGAKETARKVLEEFGPIFEKNPHYDQLGFLIAAAYANLGQFEEFFYFFYRSFQNYPYSYMAYRTKAILHIKLYERANTDQEREEQRKSVYDNVLIASEQKPDDSSLYKLQIVFCDNGSRDRIVKELLQKIIAENIIVPRADILFFVTESLNSGNIDLAQQFVNRAREWYEVSRVVNGAQEMIDNVAKRKTS
jgi:tetratricopeptide (TPR) repeat protein